MGFKGLTLFLASLALLATTACSSGGSGGSSATTYTLSGNLDPGNSSSSFAVKMSEPDLSLFDLKQFSRTQCTDGYFYSVYCVSFSTPPVAAEGDVDCTNGGGFSVSGLPLNEAIGCFVRRYESSSATSGSNVGAIEIPAANLNGSSDTIVASGDVALSISIDSSGTINASVQSGGDNLDSSNNADVDSAFTAANMDGVWNLTCDSENGGTTMSPHLCKCFLGEDSYGAAGYNNQDECLADQANAITGTVSLGIGLYIHTATANTDIPLDNNQSIPSGSSIKAISIWSTTGSPGSYVTARQGGEGVTTLGGSLTWSGSTPTTAVAWTSSSVTVQDNTPASRTISVPALPSDPNTMDHSDWMTWIGNLASAAESGSFVCNRGPSDANAYGTAANLTTNIECLNEILEAFDKDGIGATLPRIWIQPYCDQNGCLISSDGSDSAKNYYSANALNMARIEIEGWHMNYPTTWTNSHNYSSGGLDIQPATGLDAGIGIEPSTRHVFEPLIVSSRGAGFRQRHDYDRHYQCVSSGANSEQIQDANCNGGGYYELVCYVVEELAIKFIGTSSPMDVVFDQIESTVSARLFHHNGSAPTEVTPATSGGVIAMCNSKVSAGSGTFMAKGTKQ